ncbi:MAG TPA: hypothetical protein VMV82_06045 [Candidatus Dormibacteraeota bacterium]|nr:hypothetical protein [Candidatus Dormibacteraeota bacterium]
MDASVPPVFLVMIFFLAWIAIQFQQFAWEHSTQPHQSLTDFLDKLPGMKPDDEPETENVEKP